jgi:uncharacterized protein (DUF1501 family)
MKRRAFLSVLPAALCFGTQASLSWAAKPVERTRYHKLLVLVELKGGNDGLNTLIPYADPRYCALRPNLAIARAEVRQLDETRGLHPALEAVLPIWQAKELALVQGLGYAEPNLSHFRSIEIWETASSSRDYLPEGWLARAFARHPPPKDFAADGVSIAGGDPGPLAGGARSVALASPAEFQRLARLAQAHGHSANPALRHLLRVEQDIVSAAAKLQGERAFRTPFPASDFGRAVASAAQVAAMPGQVAVLRLSLGGFDTHRGQPGTHAKLLRDLAEGLAALRAALLEIDRWRDTLIVSYAEFGRRPKENHSQGTDHGTANLHFALGGRVKGGLYGSAPALDRLDGEGNLVHTTDFRQLYATVLEDWWGLPSRDVLGGKFPGLGFLRV